MGGRRSIGGMAVLGQVKTRQWEQWGSGITPRRRRGQREPAFSRECYVMRNFAEEQRIEISFKGCLFSSLLLASASVEHSRLQGPGINQSLCKEPGAPDQKPDELSKGQTELILLGPRRASLLW